MEEENCYLLVEICLDDDQEHNKKSYNVINVYANSFYEIREELINDDQGLEL